MTTDWLAFKITNFENRIKEATIEISGNESHSTDLISRKLIKRISCSKKSVKSAHDAITSNGKYPQRIKMMICIAQADTF